MVILKLEYFCFVHFFLHRTVSRFEAENVVISEMKENFSFFEIFAGILIITFSIQVRLRAAVPVRLRAHVPDNYLSPEKSVQCLLQFITKGTSDPLENSQTENSLERR